MKNAHHREQLNKGLHFKLGRLREMLQLEKDFHEISEYFHTVLVPDDEFLGAGSRGTNARLLAALQGVLGTLAPGGQLGPPLLLRLEQEKMCHGYATWGSGHTIFFYFEALDMGFCMYSRSLLDPQVVYSRFRLAAVPNAPWNAAMRGSA